jgi:TPP-dependent indolepyruvate ferredoxin oxidoreductase alpha subunit
MYFAYYSIHCIKVEEMDTRQKVPNIATDCLKVEQLFKIQAEIIRGERPEKRPIHPVSCLACFLCASINVLRGSFD